MCINPSVFGSDGLGKFVKSKPVAVLGNGAPYKKGITNSYKS
ncbi:hypothetical protein JCM19275_2773 [Nonlabens ulvanivorans]|uniref:Uncharacterized protein n=1 Tax=Nonlabens ulvanivorans TaxID=906888 RepID=A0A090WAE5_NONUL|nr:hypothetical protein JCM19275_2773 [Nonlabens ulvanivorans]